MNINIAIKVANAIKNGDSFPQADMQAAFDRLSKPDQAHSLNAQDLRSVLWDTDKVDLD